jgi:hypothetical protein
MKKLLLFLLVISAGACAYLYWLAPPKIPAGKVLVTQAYLDSLADIANQPPKIEIVVETVWKDTTIYIDKDPPTPTDEGEHYAYADSLKTPEVSIWVWDKISKYGIIEDRKWAYRLHVPLRITERHTIYQPVPKPYPVYVERNYQQNPKIRYYGMAGWGNIKSIDGGVIYKQRFMAGAQAGFLADQAVFQAKIGIVF